MRVVLGLAAALVLAFGSQASARVEGSKVSRSQATKIALHVLKPSRGTVVFALPTMLGPREKVGEAFTGQLRPAGAGAWLFWADLGAYEHFAHPSRLLLIDQSTGRVVRDQTMLWWPIVGRGPPPFLRSRVAYNGARYRVFPSRPTKRAVSSFDATAASQAAADLPKGVLKGDCYVSIGPDEDPEFSGSINSWLIWARGVGIASYRVKADADGVGTDGNPTGSDVKETIAKAVADGCKDVVLRIHGHGAPPPRGADDPFADGGSFDGDYSKLNLNNLPFVSSVPKLVGEGLEPDRGAGITSRQLREIINEFGSTTFKVVVESCFSGRFANDLGNKKPDNLLILFTSTSASDASYGPLPPQVDLVGTYSFDHWFFKDGRLQQRGVTVKVPSSWSPRVTTESTGGWLQAFDVFAQSSAQIDRATANAAKTGYPFMVFALRDMYRGAPQFDLLSGVTRPQVLFRPKVEVASSIDVKTYDLGSQFGSAWQAQWFDDGTPDGAIGFTDRTRGQFGVLDPATGSAQAFALNVTNPNGIAVVSPTVLALAGVGGLEVFDRSGQGKVTTFQMDAQLVGLAVGPQNRNLYATDFRHNQIVTVRPPYATASDVTKTLLPASCIRPSGIVPTTTGITVLCQQTNNIAFLDLAGSPVGSFALPSPNVGAQEARPTGTGGIVFSGFGSNRLYHLLNGKLQQASTGKGPAVPTVVTYPDDYDDLFARGSGDVYAFVPHFTAGGASTVEFDPSAADGTSKLLSILPSRNLVGSAIGPGCSPWMADATAGKPALHRVTFSVPGAPTRPRAVGNTRIDHPTTCSDFTTASTTHTLTTPVPASWSTASKLQLGLVGYRSDAWGAAPTFRGNFPIELSAKVTGVSAVPRVSLQQTGPYTAVATVTGIPKKAKTISVTITSTGATSPFGILSAARLSR